MHMHMHAQLLTGCTHHTHFPLVACACLHAKVEDVHVRIRNQRVGPPPLVASHGLRPARAGRRGAAVPADKRLVSAQLMQACKLIKLR